MPSTVAGKGTPGAKLSDGVWWQQVPRRFVLKEQRQATGNFARAKEPRQRLAGQEDEQTRRQRARGGGCYRGTSPIKIENKNQGVPRGMGVFLWVRYPCVGVGQAREAGGERGGPE